MHPFIAATKNHFTTECYSISNISSRHERSAHTPAASPTQRRQSPAANGNQHRRVSHAQKGMERRPFRQPQGCTIFSPTGHATHHACRLTALWRQADTSLAHSSSLTGILWMPRAASVFPLRANRMCSIATPLTSKRNLHAALFDLGATAKLP